MLKLMIACPLASVLTAPVAGQRSSVVRYWTVDQTSKLAAGFPSRTSLITTFSVVFWAGVGLDTLRFEPTNRAATLGSGVAVGAAVGHAVTVASTTRRDEFER